MFGVSRCRSLSALCGHFIIDIILENIHGPCAWTISAGVEDHGGYQILYREVHRDERRVELVCLSVGHIVSVAHRKNKDYGQFQGIVQTKRMYTVTIHTKLEE